MTTIENSEPGTLVWVGTTKHPEFEDAFEYCRASAAQIANRSDLQELVARPAGFVRRIIFAREDRRPLSVTHFQEIADRYRDSELLALTSSLCDGEARTGQPWPGIKHLRFSRWSHFLPLWLEPCGYLPLATKTAAAVLFLADRYETAEPHLDVAFSEGIRISWKRKYVPAMDRNFELLIWDESVAEAASITQWRSRLQASHFANATTEGAKHVWLTTCPRITDIRNAVAGGIAEVFSKPVMTQSIFQI